MKFVQTLEEWWTSRSKEVSKNPSLSPITLRGIFYLMRKSVGPRQMPKTKSGFYSALQHVEEESKISREDLRIISEPKVILINRKGQVPINKAQALDLKDSIALLFVEKATILTALEEDHSLTDRGFTIIQSMGFSGREVDRVIKEAQNLGIPIFSLVDYDPSGLLISKKLEKSGIKINSLGIDPQLVKDLGLTIEDVRESLPSKKNKLSHLKYLKDHYPKEAKEFEKIGEKGKLSRIEIDSVFSLAGKDRFVEEILKRADLAVPIKPLQKVLKHKKVPTKVDDLRNSMHTLVDELFDKTSEDAEKPHKDVKQSFNKLRLSEIENSIEKTIDSEATNGTTKVLEDTIDALQKLLEQKRKAQGP